MKHGEGETWYLQAKHYAEDLLSDVRRRRFIASFASHPEHLAESVEKLKRLDRAPRFVRRVVAWRISRKMKKMHFGQPVPIEDVERILAFTNSVVRVACICRYATRGVEGRYCYGVSMAPEGGQFTEIMANVDGSYLHGPDSGGVEQLTKADALDAMRAHEREGMCHTVWTFITPFIGAICNCDRTDCLAMRATVGHEVPVMFRGEYVAEVDPDACVGCRACLSVCPFGAIGYSAAREKVEIDPKRCYGCGACRSVCTHDAIALTDRRSVPVAADLW